MTDLVELGLLIGLILLAVAWPPWIERRARRLADHPLWAMSLLAFLPVALRLLLLPNHPVPSPDVCDEFSHLLVADTLRHFRLANPPHALSQFFETIFVLQQPTYSSIYPLGQGMALALGRAIFGVPWAGVVLATAAFCALCYWMLRGWTSPAWALAGGTLAVIEFGPLSGWMNTYWGGPVPAAAGCLVFGALPRLRNAWRTRDALLLGAGLGLHLLTRPFESMFVLASVLLFFAPELRSRAGLQRVARTAGVLALAVLPAIALMLLDNRQVTAQWTTLPYVLSREQYGVPATLTFQPNPTPHRPLTPEQELEYRLQSSLHGNGPETIQKYLLRLQYRLRFVRFFLLAPLWLALPAFVPAMRELRYAWVAATLLLFAAGTNFYPMFLPHYVAAVTCLIILVSVAGLDRLSRFSPQAARIIVLLCVLHFVFWYGVHVFEGSSFSAAAERLEPWDSINHGNPEARIFVNRQLASAPGQQLVFVRYSPGHRFQEEWVYNEADIDAARVVWARDLRPDENTKLRSYYPARTVWLLEPDNVPPRLTRNWDEAPAGSTPIPASGP